VMTKASHHGMSAKALTIRKGSMRFSRRSHVRAIVLGHFV